MNYFQVSGIVSDITVKKSGQGRTYWKFSLDAEGEEVSGLVSFKPIRAGDHVEVEGYLSGWNGYVQARVQRVCNVEDEGDPIPRARNLDGETLCTVGPDGELPF